MYKNIYKNKRVLVTGHTGFKGSWLCSWLLELGAHVAGFSLNVPTDPSNFEVLDLKSKIVHCSGDIRNREALCEIFNSFKPEIVFHLAAQALVRPSYADPATTFETNALGTMNVLECLRINPSVKAAVIITSDKCYRNAEWIWGYRENDLLGGGDPYSASKGCAELIAYSYMESFFRDGGPCIATTRAGNVIGGGDWASDRIIPDCARAWFKGETAVIRNPGATRPWQHVLEPLSGYLWLGALLFQNEVRVRNEAFNFGPPAEGNYTVEKIVQSLVDYWPGFRSEINQSGIGNVHESTLLKLCCDKAMSILSWRAVLDFSETIRMTAEWYRAFYEGGAEKMFDLTVNQIEAYVSKAKALNLLWTV